MPDVAERRHRLRLPGTGKYGVRRGILFHPWPSGQVAVGMRGVFVQWRSNQIQTV